MDECQGSPCEQICNNEMGGYQCSCEDGYSQDLTDSSQCYASQEISCQTRLVTYDASGLNLDPQHSDYINLKSELEPLLKAEMANTVETLTTVTITNMEEGSLIIDMTAVANAETNADAGTHLVEAVLKISQDGVTINGTQHTATVVIGGIQVTNASDKCDILQLIVNCTNGCQISDSKAFCVESDDEKDIGLFVGLGIGVPLVLLGSLAIIIFIIHKHKKTEYQFSSQVCRVGPLSHRETRPWSGGMSTDRDNKSLLLSPRDNKSLVSSPRDNNSLVLIDF